MSIPQFHERLEGKRIVLLRNLPILELAETIFAVVEENREYLAPWFPWVEKTHTTEAYLEHLQEHDSKTINGTRIQYGIYVDEVFVGNITLFAIDYKKQSAELGYWLAESHKRKGYMTEAMALVEQEAFAHLGLHRIQIRCDLRNEASAALALSCGYQWEGTLREVSYSAYFQGWRSVKVFSKLVGEWEGE